MLFSFSLKNFSNKRILFRLCREGNVFLPFESLTNILLASQSNSSLITGNPANALSKSPFH